MKKITVRSIHKLNPCYDRFENFRSEYPDFSGTMRQFMALKSITHEDKLWVYFRMIPKKEIGKVVADFAEEVLHTYESRYPDDDRPRRAIEAARSGKSKAAAYAAYAAAARAAYAAAYAAAAARAAYAAASAAYAAASAAAYAADAAAYAAARAAAYAAAADAPGTASNRKENQRKIMLRHWNRIQRKKKRKVK